MRRLSRLALLVLAIAAGLFAACAGRTREAATAVNPTCELARTGKPARAIVLEATETDQSDRAEATLELKLRVLPAAGKPFEAATRLTLSRLLLPQVEVGDFVPARYDASDPTRVVIDLVPCDSTAVGRP